MNAANMPESNAKPVERRKFLRLAAAAASLAVLGPAAIAFVQFLQQTMEGGTFGGKVVAGNIRAFPVGTVTMVRPMHGFVSRVGPEGVLVMSWKCPHLGCMVPWVEAEGRFNCPCHSSLYNTKGEVLAGIATHPLDLFPAKIVNNQLVVDTSRVIQRTQFDPSQITPFPSST